MMLAKRDNNEQLLNMHFNNRFADECGAEKRPERDEEVAACDAGQVEKRVWYLQMLKDMNNDC